MSIFTSCLTLILNYIICLTANCKPVHAVQFEAELNDLSEESYCKINFPDSTKNWSGIEHLIVNLNSSNQLSIYASTQGINPDDKFVSVHIPLMMPGNISEPNAMSRSRNAELQNSFLSQLDYEKFFFNNGALYVYDSNLQNYFLLVDSLIKFLKTVYRKHDYLSDYYSDEFSALERLALTHRDMQLMRLDLNVIEKLKSNSICSQCSQGFVIRKNMAQSKNDYVFVGDQLDSADYYIIVLASPNPSMSKLQVVCLSVRNDIWDYLRDAELKKLHELDLRLES
jgi:hypothetical protein